MVGDETLQFSEKGVELQPRERDRGVESILLILCRGVIFQDSGRVQLSRRRR